MYGFIEKLASRNGGLRDGIVFVSIMYATQDIGTYKVRRCLFYGTFLQHRSLAPECSLIRSSPGLCKMLWMVFCTFDLVATILNFWHLISLSVSAVVSFKYLTTPNGGLAFEISFLPYLTDEIKVKVTRAVMDGIYFSWSNSILDSQPGRPKLNPVVAHGSLHDSCELWIDTQLLLTLLGTRKNFILYPGNL